MRLIAAILVGVLMAGAGVTYDPIAAHAEEAVVPGAKEPCQLAAAGVELVCMPARINAEEGRWTFFLRGGAAFEITGAELHAGGESYPTTGQEQPTPAAALLDFEYPPLPIGGQAELIVMQADGELARFEIRIVPPSEAPPQYRQRHRVRLQLEPWTLDYPLHSNSESDPTVDELGGDESFLALLRELSVERVHKALPRKAEDDSVEWLPRLKREQVTPGRYLRQYLMFIDKARSEDAYKEIFRCLPHVEAAFINVDRDKVPQ